MRRLAVGAVTAAALLASGAGTAEARTSDASLVRLGGVRVELREGFRERSRDRRVRPAIARVSLLLTLSKD